MDAPFFALNPSRKPSNLLLDAQISAGYGRLRVLDSVSLRLEDGEILGVVGLSGAGKSTLVHSLLGLMKWQGGYVDGSIRFGGRELLELNASEWRKLRGRSLALVPQSPLSALNPSLRLREHFKEAWHAHYPKSIPLAQDRLEELLLSVQLPFDDEFLRRRPHQISVGQAQRVLIVSALLHGPRLLIADEPTSALDPITQAEIVRLLARMASVNSAAMVYISHDLLSVFQLCHRVAILYQGRVVECAEASEIIAQPQHPHTRALLAALPVSPEALLENLHKVPRVQPQAARQFPDYMRPKTEPIAALQASHAAPAT